MNADRFAHQLLALRGLAIALKAQCEAVLAELEPVEPRAAAPESSETCDHPDHLRESTSAYGQPPSFYCRQCHTEVSGA